MRHAVVASFVQLGLIGSVAGCGDPPLDKLPPREVQEFPVTESRDLDLLFLIDDTSAFEQTSLANDFPRFIDVLSSIPGGLPATCDRTLRKLRACPHDRPRGEVPSESFADATCVR